MSCSSFVASPLATGLRLLLLGLLGCASLCAQDAARDDLRPLKSAAPHGLGPAALPTLHHTVMGAVSVYGSASPDLFVYGNLRTAGLMLFRWLRHSPDGVPIFAPAVPVSAPGEGNGTIFATEDGRVHGLWIVKGDLVHAVFDRDALAFRPAGRLSLKELPSTPSKVAAFPNADGSVDLAFELAGDGTPAREAEKEPSSEKWRPYDAGGISTEAVRYRYLYGARAPALLKGPLTALRQISPTRREVLMTMCQLAPVNFGGKRERGLLVGSRMGELRYYSAANAQSLVLTGRHLIAGEDGNVLRHPSISVTVVAYPDAQGGSPHLIAAGEGALYFYRATGRVTKTGAPVFHDPVPVLQEDADLYAGTLPSPSAVDWDGDGVTDLVVGNSEGFVLFFKNIGDDLSPRFLPGERLQADGREIQIQAGYSGSVQGTKEARWGYLGPNVVDWTGDGLPDIVMGDVTGNYTVYLNRGTKTSPQLEAARPLYCDGLELHGVWRSRPAVGTIDGRTALVIVDGEENFHLYWKLDDANVVDGGVLTLADGSVISIKNQPGGGTGRCKPDFFDADGDGHLDLVVGTGRRSAIPNQQTGYPFPVLGKRTLGTPLLLRNTGRPGQPVFEHPAPFAHVRHGLVQPGGAHETGAIGTRLGGGRNFIFCNEAGRLYLLRGENLRLMTPEEAARHAGKPNPLPLR